MEKRIDILVNQPLAGKALMGLESYLGGTQLSKTHKELIKIRASQINGCAFCIDMHTKDALKYGETTQRLFLLNAWQETDLFTPEERVLLAITEEVTLINLHGLTNETYQQALAVFEESYIAQLIMAVIAINAWNRIAISTHKEVLR